MFESLNPSVIGYTLDVVGLFFLASAITFKNPRRQIEEILGVERPRSLSTVRDHLVNQIQVYIGFVFLVAGHVLLMGDALGTASAPTDDPNLVWIVAVLLLATIATMGFLKIVQLVFTRRKLRRILAEVLRESRYSLEKHQNVAVQIGELLQIPPRRDQSVPEYIDEVKAALGLQGGAPPDAVRPDRKVPRAAETPRT
jgi:hypothetical protein